MSVSTCHYGSLLFFFLYRELMKVCVCQDVRDRDRKRRFISTTCGKSNWQRAPTIHGSCICSLHVAAASLRTSQESSKVRHPHGMKGEKENCKASSVK